MSGTATEKMLGYHRRKREQGCGPDQRGAFDRLSPEVHARLRLEAELVRWHESTCEANAFLGGLLDDRLAGLEAGED